jgi:uncharacterized Zn-finger protein
MGIEEHVHTVTLRLTCQGSSVSNVHDRPVKHPGVAPAHSINA